MRGVGWLGLGVMRVMGGVRASEVVVLHDLQGSLA